MRAIGLIRVLFVAVLVSGWQSGRAEVLARPMQETPVPQEPQVQAASGEGQQALKRFKFSDQLECKLFAAEPDVANIVGFHRDYSGNVFVCETFRQDKNSGVEDNRSHGHWMDEELQAQTVQDRIDYVLKHVPDAARLYTAKDDRIRLIIDQDEDGAADRATVFAKGFNRLEMGTGADVLSYRNQVYYTCIPDLFKLTDDDGDGVADRRESLHSGYGVRFAFRGHDLHGLVVGPDGRLYFSIGDRGYNLSSEIVDPTSGAIFRCELDGSNLEVFSTGLRNPQNLAFDDLGNLFTGDNNSDSGDRARWVYLVPGGDSGWRMYYQYLSDRGPFNREKIWHPWHEHSPAYIIPPIENISDGPSGLEYYPGTGFGDDYRGRFFLCDFRGSSVNSGIRSFRNQSAGAFWKLVDSDQPIWGILPTDLQFASDGKLYVSDWVNGWVGENKGRIYSFAHREHSTSDIVKEVQTLLKSGLTAQTTEQLVRLIGHPDRRIRQEAQFELVNRREHERLQEIAGSGTDRLSRVHAIWGLAQLLRVEKSRPQSQRQPRLSLDSITGLLERLADDNDPEIRAQCAYLVGEVDAPLQDTMVRLAGDENLRVRYFAAMALARVGEADSLIAIARMVRENNNSDPIVRHGGVMAIRGAMLRGIVLANDDALKNACTGLVRDESPAVRIALTVALRKLLAMPSIRNNESALSTMEPLLGELLRDADPLVALEAARAVYDLPVAGLMDELAAVPVTEASGAPRCNVPHLQSAWASRVVEANYRVGDQAAAERLGAMAAGISVESRLQAVRALGSWMKPGNNDPLLHDWRPVDLSNRNLADAQTVIAKNFNVIFTGDSEIKKAVLDAVGKLQIPGLEHELEAVLRANEQEVGLRVQALQSLSQLDRERFSDALSRLQTEYEQSVDPFSPELATELARLSAPVNEAFSLSILQQMVGGESISIANKQLAIAAASGLNSVPAREWLKSLLQQAQQKTLDAELRLDVVLACKNHQDRDIQGAGEAYLTGLISASNPSAKYADTLKGGDLERGRRIFETKSEVSCVRCHRVAGEDVAVGPNLADIGTRRTRQQLLDSIVQPNLEIAEGFGQIKVQTLDGLLLTGLLKQDTDTEMVLLDSEGKQLRVPKEDIDAIQPGLSSMPLDLVQHLSLVELRDLIEFLAQQTDQPGSGLEHGRQ